MQLTSEGNLVNVHVRSDGGTSDLSETRDDVDNTSGEAGFLDELTSVKSRERSLLSTLENDSVTTSNGRANLPCPHEDFRNG